MDQLFLALWFEGIFTQILLIYLSLSSSHCTTSYYVVWRNLSPWINVSSQDSFDVTLEYEHGQHLEAHKINLNYVWEYHDL